MEVSQVFRAVLIVTSTTALETVGQPAEVPPHLNDQQSQVSLVNLSARHCSVRTFLDRDGVLIGALFQFHENYDSAEDRCSAFLKWDAVEQAESFFFVHEKLRSVNSTVVDWAVFGIEDPSEALGWIVRDTCTSNVLGTLQALDLATESPSYQEISEEFIRRYFGTNAIQQLRATCPTKLLAVVGPASNEEVAAVSPVLTSYKIPHVSFWASSTSFNDVNRYPFLFRTVPSIDHQVTAMIDLIQYFGWNYIAVVAAQDDLYSGRGVDLIQVESHARHFCIGHVLRFSIRDRTTMRELARKLREDVQAKVVILFAPLTPAKAFLDMMEEENVTEKIIVGSNDWVSRLAPDGKPILQRSSAVFGFTPYRLVLSQAREWVQEFVSLRESLGKLHPYLYSAIAKDPWLRVFVEHRLQCRFTGNNSCPDLDDSLFSGEKRDLPLCTENDFQTIPDIPFLGRSEPIMFAMEVIAEGIQQAILESTKPGVSPSQKTNCAYPSGNTFRTILRRMKMPCMNGTGLCRVFDENQQVYPAFEVQRLPLGMSYYNLETIGLWYGERGSTYLTRLTWHKPPTANIFMSYSSALNSSQWPASACSRQCQLGERRVFYNARLALCCWTCERCADNHISNTTNSNSCEACPLGTKPTINLDGCVPSDLVQLEYSNGFVIVILIFSIVGASLNILTLALFFRHRAHTLVRSSDVSITTVILVMLLCTHLLSPFTVGAGNLTVGICKFDLTASAPFTIAVLAAILVKTNRFARIFRASAHLRSRTRLFSTPVQLVIIAAITLVGVILSAVYCSTVGTDTVYPSQTERRVICASSDAWEGTLSAYRVTLILITVVLAFMTRKLPENYNEAQQIYFAALATLVVYAGFIPALYISDSYLRPLIITSLAEGQVWAMWLCLYLPRIVVLVRSPLSRKRRSTFIGRTPMPGCVQIPLSEQSRESVSASKEMILEGN